jgi:ADP-ribose pyrophosphatase YjhB (NUDIX family)
MIQTEPRVGCGAAIMRDGKLLLIQRRREPEAGHWGLPGGKVDLYETMAAAAEREIFEELGLTIRARTLSRMRRVNPRSGSRTRWRHAAGSRWTLCRKPLTVSTLAALTALQAR